jgi:hypothetical protein
MDPKFFRKYADLINEAEEVVIPPAVKKAATKIARGVSKIANLGDDDGYNWLDEWDSPIGDAWDAYYELPMDQLHQTEFDEFLLQTVDHNVILEYGADVQSWVNDAKFDIE